MDKEYIKQETLRLYRSLPQNKQERMKRLDVRDKVIELNYAFFGYVASHTFINNSSVTYEDKLQSALLHFCELWWAYLWEGDETHKGYRTDLSFTVFFKPRIGEMIERELNEVKYSIRRSLCMEVGQQIGKHWGKVTYEDLSDPRVHLSPDKMNSLKAIFGTLYIADLSEHETYLEAPCTSGSILDDITDEYDTIEELLVQEMIRTEEKLTDSKLHKLSTIYSIDFKILKEKLPTAERMLYKQIQDKLDLQTM